MQIDDDTLHILSHKTQHNHDLFCKEKLYGALQEASAENQTFKETYPFSFEISGPPEKLWQSALLCTLYESCFSHFKGKCTLHFPLITTSLPMELPQNQNNYYGTVLVGVLVLCGFTVMDLADAVVSDICSPTFQPFPYGEY